MGSLLLFLVCFHMQVKNPGQKEFPSGSVVKTPNFHCRGSAGSMPFGGTVVPHAAWHGQKQAKRPTNNPHQRARGQVVRPPPPPPPAPLAASPGREVAPGLVRDSWVIFSRIPCHCLLRSCVPGSFLVVTENGPACENCSFSCRLGYFLWTHAHSWDCWVTGRDRGSGFSLCLSGLLGR